MPTLQFHQFHYIKLIFHLSNSLEHLLLFVVCSSSSFRFNLTQSTIRNLITAESVDKQFHCSSYYTRSAALVSLSSSINSRLHKIVGANYRTVIIKPVKFCKNEDIQLQINLTNGMMRVPFFSPVLETKIHRRWNHILCFTVYSCIKWPINLSAYITIFQKGRKTAVCSQKLWDLKILLYVTKKPAHFSYLQQLFFFHWFLKRKR